MSEFDAYRVSCQWYPSIKDKRSSNKQVREVKEESKKPLCPS